MSKRKNHGKPAADAPLAADAGPDDAAVAAGAGQAAGAALDPAEAGADAQQAHAPAAGEVPGAADAAQDAPDAGAAEGEATEEVNGDGIEGQAAGDEGAADPAAPGIGDPDGQDPGAGGGAAADDDASGDQTGAASEGKKGGEGPVLIAAVDLFGEVLNVEINGGRDFEVRVDELPMLRDLDYVDVAQVKVAEGGQALQWDDMPGLPGGLQVGLLALKAAHERVIGDPLYPELPWPEAPAPIADAEEEAHACPICAEAFKPDDTCAMDIELGICHAACLQGSPTVDLITGEPKDGPMATFRYGDDDEEAYTKAVAAAFGTPDPAPPQNRMDVNVLAAASAAATAFGTTNMDGTTLPRMDFSWISQSSFKDGGRAALEEAAAFLRQNRDARPETVVIHLKLKGFRDIAEPAGRLLVAWKVFALTLNELDQHDLLEKTKAVGIDLQRRAVSGVRDRDELAMAPFDNHPLTDTARRAR